MNEATLNYPRSSFSGCNSKDFVQETEVEGRSYFVPPHSEYHSTDVSQFVEKIGNRKFNVSLLLNFHFGIPIPNMSYVNTHFI